MHTQNPSGAASDSATPSVKLIYPRLRVFVGPMFSGKTSTALKTAETAAIVRRGYAVHIVHSFDAPRAATVEAGVYTHSSVARGSTSVIKKLQVDQLSKVDRNLIANAAAVAIDEANLFGSDDLVSFVKSIMRPSETAPHDVVVCGLDSDMCQRPFSGGITRLLSDATEFRKLSAVCLFCVSDTGIEREANYTIRTVPLPKKGTLVGGPDEYAACCREHVSHSAVTESELDEWLKS